MEKNNRLKFDEVHELVANGLVFLSLTASLFLFGIVFVSDHELEIAVVSAGANNLLAQAQPAQSLLGYARPPVKFDYSDDQLRDQLNKFLSQLEEMSR